MRIAIAGAGALGSLFGARLADADHDVTLIARGDHARAIREDGLRLLGRTETVVHPDVVLPGEPSPHVDAVLFTCKTYDTRPMLQERPDLVADAGIVATAQNGLGLEQVLADHVPAERVVGVTTSNGCTLERPGVVRHAGLGDTLVGPLVQDGAEAALELHEALHGAGLTPTLVEDILPARWAKVAVNAAINPLATLLEVPNGELVADAGLREELRAIASEVARVALAVGVDAMPRTYADAAVTVAERTAENRCSMLQDRDRGRRTEIDAITGAVAAAAEENGVEAPRCSLLTSLVHALGPRADAGVTR